MQRLLLSTALVIGLAACSSSAPKIEITEFEPGSCRFKQSEEVAPDWFCAPDEMFDDAYVYGVGSANQGYQDEYLSRKIAMTSARADIAAKVKTQITEEFRRNIDAQEADGQAYMESVTKLVTEANVDLRLPPSRKRAQTFDAKGNFYVLVEVKRSEVMEIVRKMQAEIDRKARKAVQLPAAVDPTVVVDAMRDVRNSGE